MNKSEDNINPALIVLNTLNSRVLLVELLNNFNKIHIDYSWDKIIGDDNIIFEFDKGMSVDYELVGTYKECLDNPDLLSKVIDKLPNYIEVMDIPNNDPYNWEVVDFLDDFGKPFKYMGRNKKYRKIFGYNYPNYNIPQDVMDNFPLSNQFDSFMTLLRKNNIYTVNKDYLILKQLNYEESK